MKASYRFRIQNIDGIKYRKEHEEFQFRGIPHYPHYPHYQNNKYGKYPNQDNFLIRRYPILFPRNNFNENRMVYNNFQNHKNEGPYNINNFYRKRDEPRELYRPKYFRENFKKEFNPINYQRSFKNFLQN